MSETRPIFKESTEGAVPGAFSYAIINTIFSYRMVDNFFISGGRLKRESVPSFLFEYLKYRIINESSGGHEALVLLRKIAEHLASKTSDGRTAEDYIQEISRVMVARNCNMISSFWTKEYPTTPKEFEDHVKVAALYTDTAVIVDEMIQNGTLGRTRSSLFGSGQQFVAAHGDEAMVNAALKDGSHFMGPDSRKDMLVWAASAGNLNTVNFVWNSHIQDYPWVFVRKGNRSTWRSMLVLEHIHCTTLLRNKSFDQWVRNAGYHETSLANMGTPSREVFKFLMEKRSIHCTTRVYGEKWFTRLLGESACYGWADMAAHYLDLGAKVDGPIPNPGILYEDPDERPLLKACKYGYEDLVDVLLAHDADTSKPILEFAVRKGNLAIVKKLLDHKAELGDALLEAAKKGWGDIVQELLQRGATIDHNLQPLLLAAMKHEHTAMFHMLVQANGGEISNNIKSECINKAREKGLESMAQLVEQVPAARDCESLDVKEQLI